MTTIIFAAGPATRWQNARAVKWGGVRGVSDPPEFKQMMLIGEEPNILRTTRLLREAGESKIVILATKGLKEILRDCEEVVYPVMDDGEQPLFSRVFESDVYWSSSAQARFLHGDVVFSRDTINKVLDWDGNNPACFFGRFGPNQFTGKAAPELFGFVVRESIYGQLLSACAILSGPSRLWDLRDVMRDRGFSVRGADQEIFDWTDDVDSGEEYVDFYPKLANFALHEEDLHREKVMTNGHG